MLVNADFSRRAIVTPRDYQWVPSPQPGVQRVMLDRVGVERARATSIVRYAAGSRFPSHAHPGGEEILVLSGVFSEGDSHYPAGWYLRNPPGSRHQPSSAPGATLFVKLCQMSPVSRACVRLNTMDARHWAGSDKRALCSLYVDTAEAVWLERLAPGIVITIAGAAELLVLEGNAHIDGQSLSKGAWLRWPAAESTSIAAGAQGVCLYVKTLALPSADIQGEQPC